MELAKKETKYTVEEYLAYDDSLVDGKAEYYDGVIIDMAGGSFAHGVIQSNFTGEILAAIKGRDCSVFSSDVKIGIAETSSYLYPDMGVVCGDPRFSELRDDILINPLLLVEVLSERTSSLDRRIKCNRYRMIPSLREIVLVGQKTPQVEVYSRNQTGRWESDLYIELSQIVLLQSLNISIPMEDIYRRVIFPDQPSTPDNIVRL